MLKLSWLLKKKYSCNRKNGRKTMVIPWYNRRCVYANQIRIHYSGLEELMVRVNSIESWINVRLTAIGNIRCLIRKLGNKTVTCTFDLWSRVFNCRLIVCAHQFFDYIHVFIIKVTLERASSCRITSKYGEFTSKVYKPLYEDILPKSPE